MVDDGAPATRRLLVDTCDESCDCFLWEAADRSASPAARNAARSAPKWMAVPVDRLPPPAPLVDILPHRQAVAQQGERSTLIGSSGGYSALSHSGRMLQAVGLPANPSGCQPPPASADSQAPGGYSRT